MNGTSHIQTDLSACDRGSDRKEIRLARKPKLQLILTLAWVGGSILASETKASDNCISDPEILRSKFGQAETNKESIRFWYPAFEKYLKVLPLVEVDRNSRKGEIQLKLKRSPSDRTPSILLAKKVCINLEAGKILVFQRPNPPSTSAEGVDALHYFRSRTALNSEPGKVIPLPKRAPAGVEAAPLRGDDNPDTAA